MIFLHAFDIRCLYSYEIEPGRMFMCMGLFLTLIFISSKVISWVLPKSKKVYTSTVEEPVEVNILPLDTSGTYVNSKKMTFIARVFIIALILVFVFRPISEVLNLN